MYQLSGATIPLFPPANSLFVDPRRFSSFYLIDDALSGPDASNVPTVRCDGNMIETRAPKNFD
jgi:hypothetical protein